MKLSYVKTFSPKTLSICLTLRKQSKHINLNFYNLHKNYIPITILRRQVVKRKQDGNIVKDRKIHMVMSGEQHKDTKRAKDAMLMLGLN